MPNLLARLGVSLLLSPRELSTLVSSAPYRYKVYQIEKRTPGQFRTIAQPAREVKAVQRWVLRHVLNEFAIHPAATAYRKRRSILHNAKPHTRSRYLLKMDFKDFFPSLRADDFRSFLKRQEVDFDATEVSALCSILFWLPKGELRPVDFVPDLRLSIGAPTSPALSNILMFDFDRRISDFCEARGVAYTRYADDLSFSAMRSEDLAAVESAVLRWCARSKSPRLTVNATKTVRASKAESRRVTGLVVTNDRRVSIGRDTKRRLRASVHHFAVGRLAPDEIARLRGMLCYVNSVEPTFLERLRDYYGADVIARCLDSTTTDG